MIKTILRSRKIAISPHKKKVTLYPKNVKSQKSFIDKKGGYITKQKTNIINLRDSKIDF